MKVLSVKTLFLMFTLLLPLGLQASVEASAEANIVRAIERNGLKKYQKAGIAVKQFLKISFIREMDQVPYVGAGHLEAWDARYNELLRPGALEGLEHGRRAQTEHETQVFFEEVDRALTLKSQYQSSFRSNPQVRRHLQDVFIGLLHISDIKIRTHIDSSLDELMRLHRFLLSHGTFYSTGNVAKVRLDDFWWDLMWVRGHAYPADLVELHLQKVASIAAVQGPVWKNRLNRYYVSASLYALKKNETLALNQEKPSVIALRLATQALDRAIQLAQPGPFVKELKVIMFKHFTQSGKTAEANQLKKEIAMDLFFEKGLSIVTAPHSPWKNTKGGVFDKLGASVELLFKSLFSFITYGIGLIFVATPLEFLLVFCSLVVLGHQGRQFFGVARRPIKDILAQHQVFTKGGIRNTPRLLRDVLLLAKDELFLAWRMFMASYTASGVSFSSKFAASFLMFGIGLYFNSAKGLVESVMNQMAMLN